MAGLGNRFTEIGIPVPKYKIIAKGKSLFEWSMLSLQDFFDCEFIFISRTEIWDTTFVAEKCAHLGITSFQTVLLDEMTDGQATTVLFAEPYMDVSTPFAVYNIDTYIVPGSIKQSQITDSLDGFIPVIVAEGDRWSFVKTDDQGKVIDVAEKKPISNLATVGLYYFKSWGEYKRIYTKMKESVKQENKEYYIAPMYRDIIESDGKIAVEIIPTENVFILGTPPEIEAFDPDYLKNNI